MAETYVYGVVRDGREPDWPDGIDGRRPRLVRHDGLAAIVGTPKALPIRPERRNLLAHTEVLRAAMTVSPVLPMRFGIVLPDDDAVVGELLGPAHGELEALLADLDGRVELELKVVYDEDDLLREIVGGDKRLARLHERLRQGVSHDERVRIGETIAHAVESRRLAEEARIVHTLGRDAVAVTPPAQPPPSVLTKVSFLVDEGRTARFEEQVEKLARESAPLFRFLLHGPLPPFSFVDLALPAGAAV
jgi:hypothetical protein